MFTIESNNGDKYWTFSFFLSWKNDAYFQFQQVSPSITEWLLCSEEYYLIRCNSYLCVIFFSRREPKTSENSEAPWWDSVTQNIDIKVHGYSPFVCFHHNIDTIKRCIMGSRFSNFILHQNLFQKIIYVINMRLISLFGNKYNINMKTCIITSY